MKSISTLILAIFLLIPLQAQDKVYTVDNLPKVHLQKAAIAQVEKASAE